MGEFAGAETKEQKRNRRDANRRAEKIFVLEQRQLKLQEQAVRRQEELTLQTLGFVKDPETGEFVKAPQTEAEIATQGRAEEIQRLTQERQLANLRGEGEADPALERTLQESESNLINELRSEFGADFENTSAGAARLEEFRANANLARASSRRGDIAGTEQILQGRFGRGLATQQTALSGISGLTATRQRFLGAISQGRQIDPFIQAPGFNRGALFQEQLLSSGAAGISGGLQSGLGFIF